MAITRRWQSGAEADTTNSENLEFDSVNGNFAASTTQKKTGSHSFRVQTISSNAYGTVTIAATRQFRAGFHLYCEDDLGIGGATNQPVVISWLDAGSNELGRIEASGPNMLRIYANGAYQDTEASLRFDNWQYIGVDVKVDNAAGWIVVYQDGVEILSFTADNTGNADVVTIVVGNMASSDRWDGHVYYDDLIIDDTAGEGAAAVVPDYRFEAITPNGDGNYSNLTGSDGNQVNNFELTDERPHDSDTTYVYGDAAADEDTYAMTTVTLGTGWTCTAMIPFAMAKKTDGGVASQFKLMLRENATDWTGAAKDLATSYGMIFERRTTAPDGGAWDQGAIDDVEAGVEATGAF